MSMANMKATTRYVNATKQKEQSLNYFKELYFRSRYGPVRVESKTLCISSYLFTPFNIQNDIFHPFGSLENQCN